MTSPWRAHEHHLSPDAHTADDLSPRRRDTPTTQSTVPEETWSSFTQVVTRLQAYHDLQPQSSQSVECDAPHPTTAPPLPSAAGVKRLRVERDISTTRSTAEALAPPASPPHPATHTHVPPAWSAEWVMLVWMKAILLCPICQRLMCADVAAIDTCGHCFCRGCLIAAIEDGCAPLAETWPYNVTLLADDAGLAEAEAESGCSRATDHQDREATTVGTGPPDLAALGSVMARHQRRDRSADGHTAPPARPRRRRKVTLACPLCGGPAFKWTTMRLPLVEHICTLMEASTPDLEVRLRALKEATEWPPSRARTRRPLHAPPDAVDVISISSGSATSLSVVGPSRADAAGDDKVSKLASLLSVKTEAESEEHDATASRGPPDANENGTGDNEVDEATGVSSTPHAEKSPSCAATPPFSAPLFIAPEPLSASTTGSQQDHQTGQAGSVLRRPDANGDAIQRATLPFHTARAYLDAPRTVLAAAPASLPLLGAAEPSESTLTAENSVASDCDTRLVTPPPPPPPPSISPAVVPVIQHGAFRSLLYSDTP